MIAAQDVSSPEKLVIHLLQNWLKLNSQPADEDDTACQGHFFSLSGCNPVRLKASNRYVLCVHDYKKLWNYYSLTAPNVSQGNPFASYALFFESIALVLFEKRFIFFIKCLVMWNVMLLFLVVINQPSMVSQCLLNMVNFCGLYLVYVSCCRVYKPTLADDLLTTYTLREENHVPKFIYAEQAIKASEQIFANSSTNSLYSIFSSTMHALKLEIMHMCGYGRAGYMVVEGEDEDIENSVAKVVSKVKGGVNGKRSVSSMLGSISVNENDSRNSNALMAEQLQSHATITTQCAYYLLLNVGSKFLSSHTQSKVMVSPFGRYSLLCTLIALPILFIFNFFSFLVGYSCAVPNSFGEEQSWVTGMNCESQYIFVYGSGFAMTMFVMYTTLCVAVAVAVIGMLYGAIILHGLASCWVERYSGMRRLPVEQDTKWWKMKNYGDGHDNRLDKWKKSMEAAGAERDEHEHTSHFFMQEQTEQKEEISNNDVTDFDEKTDKYDDDIRNSSQIQDTQNSKSRYKDVIPIDEVTQHSKTLLCARIRRDAYEHYLFIQEYVRQASFLWSHVLFGLIFMCFLIFGILLYYTFAGEGSVVGYLTSAILFVSIGTFPIYCLAYANAAVDTIRESFIYQSSPADFAVLGGRDQWVYYLNQSPAYWTVFGYPITWTVLYGVMGSVVGSLLVGIATIVASL